MAKSKSRRVCVLCVALLLFVLIVCVCVAVWRSSEPCCSDTNQFQHAAVAADSQICSEIGRDILQKGGSAVDAAIAALLCTSLVNPQSMGLGGGAIFTIMDKSGKVTVVSSRETVPKQTKPGLLKDCPKGAVPIFGAEWIGVPGELRGYEWVHRHYGKLPWAELFEPSIRLAREGFPMPNFLGVFLQNKQYELLLKQLCELFCDQNKTFLKPGDTLRYPKLADTMEILAKDGAKAFYTGKIAEDLISDVQKAGGTLSLEDLKSFEVRVSDALTVPLGEYTMHVPPPPAGGALVAFILNIMQGFGLSSASVQGNEKALTLHRYIEAAKFANGQKWAIKDPSYHQHGTDYLTEKSIADHIRAKITDSAHPSSYYNITHSSERFGTTHVSVIAADGSAVSVTSTINHIFGSLVYSPKTGIILNNELADFCDRADSLTPGEQPPSSMAPAILHTKDREKMLVIGGSGGSMITSAMAQSIMNYLWLGKNLTEAIQSRMVFVTSANSVLFEPFFDESLKEEMKTLGHDVTRGRYFFNVVNGAAKERGCISAVSDARKNGKSAGY